MGSYASYKAACYDVVYAECERLRAECEALRADVVWLLAHKMIGYGDRISYAKEPRSWSLRKELDHDGTDADILRAVREARTTVETIEEGKI